MCPVNELHEIEIEHLVECKGNNTVFVATRRKNGRMHLFIVHESTGDTYSRNANAETWEKLNEQDRNTFLNRLAAVCREKQVPVYKLSGSLN